MGLRASRQVKAREGRSKGAVGMSPPPRRDDFADLLAAPAPVICQRNAGRCQRRGELGGVGGGVGGEDKGGAKKLCID